MLCMRRGKEKQLEDQVSYDLFGGLQSVFSIGLYVLYRIRSSGKIRNSPALERIIRAAKTWDDAAGCQRGTRLSSFASHGWTVSRRLTPLPASNPSHCKIKESQCREMILERQSGLMVFTPSVFDPAHGGRKTGIFCPVKFS